ncbi:MAG: TfoX/Sxy family protein [Amphritea sp.]|nr:TfoX/Sxy family protein [Amphritea sp.]MBQ0785226.1 TfoX/Sxy family protein [Amphritea sp.]
MKRLREMPGLGPKSENWLIEVGIHTPEELREIGAIRAYIRLKNESSTPPSLNFLYAMVGAIEGKSWLEIAKHEKGRLLTELEGYRELEELFQAEGINITPP